MKYLGIDYGAKRVGVAVSNAEGTIAFPRASIANNETLVSAVTRMCEEERIEGIVVGDTRTLGGGENPVTHDAEVFMEQLRGASKLPVQAVFEGWSSVEASRYARKGEEHNDAAAAAVILQRYIDMKGDGVR